MSAPTICHWRPSRFALLRPHRHAARDRVAARPKTVAAQHPAPPRRLEAPSAPRARPLRFPARLVQVAQCHPPVENHSLEAWRLAGRPQCAVAVGRAAHAARLIPARRSASSSDSPSSLNVFAAVVRVFVRRRQCRERDRRVGVELRAQLRFDHACGRSGRNTPARRGAMLPAWRCRRRLLRTRSGRDQSTRQPLARRGCAALRPSRPDRPWFAAAATARPVSVHPRCLAAGGHDSHPALANALGNRCRRTLPAVGVLEILQVEIHRQRTSLPAPRCAFPPASSPPPPPARRTRSDARNELPLPTACRRGCVQPVRGSGTGAAPRPCPRRSACCPVRSSPARCGRC